MDNKTLKVWVTKNNFSLIQKGSYPEEFEVTPPTDLTNYVEMVVNMETITEWVSKHRASANSTKNYLFD